MHHFAHLPTAACTYGVGESEQHREAKYHIYQALREHPCVSRVQVERNLKDVRPDISFCWQGEREVAIELQISAIAPDEIARRTRSYTMKHMPVLWITPYHEGVSGLTPYRTCLWERYLHALYFGKLYYWLAGEDLLPVHFDPYSLGTVSKEWYDHNKQEFRSEEFERFSPTLRTLHLGEIVPITDMKTVWRPFRQLGHFTLPKAQLWSL
jgi:competence protein CoiA